MKLNRTRPPVTLDEAIDMVLSAIDSDEVSDKQVASLQAAIFGRTGRAMGRVLAVAMAARVGDKATVAQILGRQPAS